MFAQLGDIVFEGRFTPLAINDSEEAIWVEHALVNTKSILQPMGMGLIEQNVDMLLRADFCDVAGTLKTLKDYQRTFRVLPLLWGYGDFLGEYVITNLGTTKQQLLQDGTPVSVMLQLKLREYVTPDKQAKAETDLRNNAPAVGIKKVTLDEYIAGLPPENVQSANSVSVMKSNSGTLDEVIAKYANTGQQNNTCLSSLNNVLNEVNKVQARIENPTSGIFNNTELMSTCLNLKSTATDMVNIVTGNIGGLNEILGLQAANNLLQADTFTFSVLLFDGVLGAILRNAGL